MINDNGVGAENEKKKKMEYEDADRISWLPESIIHEILSFLDMKQVVQTSILSKRWRNIWKSAPNLCFNGSLWKQTGKRKRQSGVKVYHKDKAMDFVDRVLLLRDNSSSIRKFHLSHFTSFRNAARFLIDSDPLRIVSWLIFASIRRIEEVHLNCCFPFSDSPTELPAQLFTTLKVLELHSCGPVRLPTSITSAPNLRVLKLVSVDLQLPQGNSSGELVLSCPVLVDLVLNDCLVDHLKILNVSANQLKNLVIQNRDSRVCSCEIKICTPNLTSLKLWGSFYKDYCLENLSSLVNCSIGGYGSYVGSASWRTHALKKALNGVNDISTVCYIGGYGSYVGTGYLHKQSLMKILNGVTNVSTLRIYGSCDEEGKIGSCCYEQLYYNQRHWGQPPQQQSCLHRVLKLQKAELPSKDLFDHLLNSFPNLNDLSLVGLESGHRIGAAVDLLKCSPNIKTLVWNAKQAYYYYNGELEEWGELLQFECTFCLLTYVEALNLIGTQNELKFLEFLLKNAVVLKNIKITFELERISKDTELKKLVEITKKLQSLPKASSSVEMFFPQSLDGSKIIL